MSEAVLAALITGGLSLVGMIASNIVTANVTTKKTEAALATAQAVTDTKLDELTRETRVHNGFATRVPVVEEQVKNLIRRVDDLEGYHKPNKSEERK